MFADPMTNISVKVSMWPLLEDKRYAHARRLMLGGAKVEELAQKLLEDEKQSDKKDAKARNKNKRHDPEADKAMTDGQISDSDLFECHN